MRIGVDFVIGAALCAIASIVNTDGGFEFAQSAWILPTVALCFMFGMFCFVLFCSVLFAVSS